MTVSHGTSTTGGTPNDLSASSVVVTLATVVVGGLNIISLSAQNGSATAPVITPPAGWTIWAGASPVTDGSSPQLTGGAWYRVYQSGDGTTATFGVPLSNTRWVCEPYLSTTGFSTPPVTNTAQSAYAGTTTAKTSDSVTTSVSGWIVGAMGDRNGGVYTSLTGPGTPTARATSSNPSSSTVATWDSAGDVAPGAVQWTATGPNTSVGWSLNGRLNPAPPGLTSPLKEWVATTPMLVAHRGGSDDWTEMSADAYAHCHALGVQAIEISVWRTSDGVWACSHDRTLDRVFGTTSVDITASTWASLGGYRTLVGEFPLARLDDLLNLYAGSHVIFIDNKQGLNDSALLNILDTYTNSIGHFVIKGVYNSPTAVAAKARGYATWGYFYAVDLDNGFLPTYAPNFDLLGMEYTADQTHWTTILAQGKPVLSHVCHSAANVATGAGKGATGAITGKVLGVIPTAPVAPEEPEVPVDQGSWYGYLDILKEARELAEEDFHRPRIACPNDGEPLRTGPQGQLYCPFDGWESTW